MGAVRRRIGRLRAPWLLLALVLLGAVSLYRLLDPRGVAVTIAGKTWRLEVDVERRLLETNTDLCNALPPAAVNIRRGPRTTDAAERCRYSLPAWRRLYQAQATGDATQTPTWPQPELHTLPGMAAEDLRLGPRQAFFELDLRAADGRRWTCALPRPNWQQQLLGSTLRLAVDRFGTADCGKLVL